ncbi:MAG: hypothetical protein IKT89_00475 [Clostridia bacterium]|nr:hypothetical protein [Clostridia bacterium]
MKITDTKRIGNSTELNCIAYLYDCGCEILLPYGDSQKYDIVIDYKGKFYRIQCKNANPTYKEDGSIDFITFKTAWESGRKTRTRVHYSKDDIDFFATYFKGQCYLIPVEETASTVKTIRFALPKNGQTNGITFAKDYVGKEVLERL